MSTLPIEHAQLSRDILDLVSHTNLNLLTSKYVRTQMEKKHGVELKEFRKQIDEIIRDSIEKVEAGEATSKPDIKPSTMNGNSKRKSSSKSKSPSPPKSDPQTSFLADSFDDENDKFSAIKRRTSSKIHRCATQSPYQENERRRRC